MKCKVPSCPNKINQGMFVGDLCRPCYSFAKGLVSSDLKLISLGGKSCQPEVRDYIEHHAEELLR